MIIIGAFDTEILPRLVAQLKPRHLSHARTRRKVLDPRFRGDDGRLRTFRAEYGKKARAGLLLHAGHTLEWLALDVLAAPWWRVL